jgi:thiamine biosynthesis lipoprotein
MNTVIGVILAATLVAPTQQAAWKQYHTTQRQMGVEVRIVLYAPDQQAANRATAAAYARITQLNGLMSDYDPASEVSRLSHSSTTPRFVPLSYDLFLVLRASERLSQQSAGAFDITVGPLTKLWRRARRRQEFPPADKLRLALQAVGYKNVQIDEARQAVKLLKPGMKLDLGGIAKGYAADEALRALAKQGFTRALVNASGDMAIGDPPPGAKGWKPDVTGS